MTLAEEVASLDPPLDPHAHSFIAALLHPNPALRLGRHTQTNDTGAPHFSFSPILGLGHHAFLEGQAGRAWWSDSKARLHPHPTYLHSLTCVLTFALAGACGVGMEGLWSHPLLSSLDSVALRHRALPPPYVPALQDLADAPVSQSYGTCTIPYGD